MKLSKKIMILSLFLVIVCCIGSVSATEEISDDLSSQLDSIEDVEIDNEIASSSENLNPQLSDVDSDILGDGNPVIYVNKSLGDEYDPDDHPENANGKSWETAYGGDFAFSCAKDYVDNGGTIYLADDEFNEFVNCGDLKNITIIGCGDNVIFRTDSMTIGEASPYYGDGVTFEYSTYIFKNIKFYVDSFEIKGNVIFEDCEFVNPIIAYTEFSEWDPLPTDVSIIKLFNCSLKDLTTEDSCICLDGYHELIIANCTIENITADSLVSGLCKIGGIGINISNSTFKDTQINGAVDIDENNKNLVVFENNIGNINTFRPVPADSQITISATKESLTITLKDSEGNIIKNASITITAPSHDPNFRRDITTNDKGIAVYDMAGADWTVWCAEYDGIKSRTFSAGPAEASVNLKTLAKGLNVQFTNVTDVTGKTMLIVTVKNNLSEAVANTNFTFTLNGKDYNATTDANGQFIASGLTGDVSVGVKYNGTEYDALDANSNFTFPKTESEEITPTNTTPTNTTPTNTTPTNTTPTNTTPTNTTPADDKKPTQPATDSTKINPVATKITAKKATFKKAKKAKKYTITLKAGKKAVSKVKVTIKVGKKTYTAKTNAKGKATFNLKKLTKKGKYTAVIKFAGNKNYKATSTKVKIIVK